MIGSLRGTLIDRSLDGELLVEVTGVGYRVLVAPAAFAMSDLGAAVFVFVHHHVREDAQVLYGFPTRDERDCFETLITVNGVGPKLGLAILATHPPGALRRALAADDVDALCLVPGVGKRTAQRLLLDLKSKLDLPEVDLTATAVGADGARPVSAEAREALAALGYAPEEIREAMAAIDPDAPLDEAVRGALRVLGRRR